MKRRSDSGKGRAAQFALAAVKYESDECLLWPFALREGYGCFHFNCADLTAHVFVCELVRGPRPTARHEVAHSCGKRACINWRHLRWDTRKGNHADKVVHGTHLRGERNHRTKLREIDVLAIRGSKSSERVLSEAYGVNKSTISAIRSRRNWAWL